MLGSKIPGILSKGMQTFKFTNIKKGLYSRRNLMTMNKGLNIQKTTPSFRCLSSGLNTQRYFSSLFYENQYKLYLEDPSKVSKEWKEYFDNKQTGGSSHSASSTGGAGQAASELEQALKLALSSSGGANSDQAATDTTRILNLYRSYQTVGHEKAKVEP